MWWRHAAAPKKPRVDKNSKTSAQKRSATDPDPAAAPKKPKKAKIAKVLDDGLFGLTRLRGVVNDVVFAELLTVAAIAAAAKLTLTEKQLQLAETQVKLAKETARAKRLRAKRLLRDSTKDRLVLRGIVDLRSILDDVLPKSKKVKQLTKWLLSEQDRRHVKSAGPGSTRP